MTNYGFTTIRPVDKENLDGEWGGTATPVEWPEGLSQKAIWALCYFADTAALFKYQGKYIVTDESGWLTSHGTGTPDDPMGFPRAGFKTLDEVGPWLEAVADGVSEDDVTMGDFIDY